MSKAYQNNDYITLFMYGYEYSVIIELNNDDINIINNEIKNKEKLIEIITNKIHWLWNNCNDDLEKKILKKQISENF